MTPIRSFRNGDPPALARLWNRSVPGSETVRPLTGHELDAFVFLKTTFEREGLVVAEHDGRIVGCAHAGFGPENPPGPPLRLNRELGTIGMLLVDPDHDDPELGRALVLAAERYLRRRGASVFYAGGQFPLNPFYWGVYGGSEWAGILSMHSAFHRAVAGLGYQPASTTVLFEADLAAPEVRDPKAAILRRQVRVEVVDDAPPAHWWEALALGHYAATRYRVVARAGDDEELAHATTWDMNAFGRGDGQSRLGLIDVEVHPAHRREGFGRFLVNAILRQARGQMIHRACVQTRSTNAPALALYQALNFSPVETATLYRLPAELAERSLVAD